MINTYNLTVEFWDNANDCVIRTFEGISRVAVDRYTQYFYDLYDGDVSWTIWPSNKG